MGCGGRKVAGYGGLEAALFGRSVLQCRCGCHGEVDCMYSALDMTVVVEYQKDAPAGLREEESAGEAGPCSKRRGWTRDDFRTRFN